MPAVVTFNRFQLSEIHQQLYCEIPHLNYETRYLKKEIYHSETEIYNPTSY